MAVLFKASWKVMGTGGQQQATSIKEIIWKIWSMEKEFMHQKQAKSSKVILNTVDMYRNNRK